MALGNILRGRKKFAECADVYSKGIATIEQAGKGQLGALLFPRHLLRALASSGRRRKPTSRRRWSFFPSSRTCSTISAIPGSTRACNLDEGMDMIKRAVAAAPGRRLHRRLAGLGLFPHRQLRGGGQAARARGRAQARRSDHQRSSRRRLLAGRPHAGSAFPVGACARPQARAGRPAEDRGQAKNGLPEETSSQAKAGKKSRQRRLSPSQRERSRWSSTAPAKINLTLRVLGRRADGYHELESLVAFADIADTLDLAARRARLRSTLRGPFAAACGAGGRQSGAQGRAALRQRVSDLKAGRFRARQAIPVAGGLGGGSADAAAALRLLARANDLPSTMRVSRLPRWRSAPMCRSASIRVRA